MASNSSERGSALKSALLALGALIVVVGASYVFFSLYYAPATAPLPILQTAQQPSAPTSSQQSSGQAQTPSDKEALLQAAASSSQAASSSDAFDQMTSDQKQQLLQSFHH